MDAIFSFRYISIRVTESGSYLEKWRELAGKAGNFVEENRGRYHVLQLLWFFRRQEGVSCRDFRRSVGELGEMQRLGTITQTFIPQAPVGDNEVELIIRYIEDNESRIDLHYKESFGKPYSVISESNCRWVLMGGLGCSDECVNVTEQANRAFSDLFAVIKAEGLGFEHLLRQWNYIDNITGVSQREGLEYQHYQEFNEVRAKWYNERGLTNNYPAATGIGTIGGGVIIEGIAAGLNSEYQVLPIANPRQEDAHSYSKAKLVGSGASSVPLFERAKIITRQKNGYIWVSGTAAIRGEDSVSGNIADQTRVTCDNIDELISNKNLLTTGIELQNFTVDPVYIRAYVKHSEDGIYVKEYIKQRYPDALTHVLKADICREELLVEVEGEFRLSDLKLLS